MRSGRKDLLFFNYTRFYYAREIRFRAAIKRFWNLTRKKNAIYTNFLLTGKLMILFPFYGNLSTMLAKIHVTLKSGVLDPQGKAVQHALADLGYDEVQDVNLGKYMEVQLESGLSHKEAENRIREMCDKLLANPVIETYRFTLE